MYYLTNYLIIIFSLKVIIFIIILLVKVIYIKVISFSSSYFNRPFYFIFILLFINFNYYINIFYNTIRFIYFI
jgi:hypothetical protein